MCSFVIFPDNSTKYHNTESDRVSGLGDLLSRGHCMIPRLLCIGQPIKAWDDNDDDDDDNRFTPTSSHV